MEITIEAMIAEYEKLASRHAKSTTGWSTKEIKKLTGWSFHRVNRFIDESMEAGLMVCHHEYRQTRDGGRRLVPVYVWKKKRGKK